ncbi:MAG: inositol monophosphatase family protein [Paracoccaceae bacterium]
MLSHQELLARRNAATDILRKAGDAARVRFMSRDYETESKGTQDFVSVVDRETEHFIETELTKAFPDDTIMGEESGGVLGSMTWIVDPIDGTSNFVRGIGHWCLSAALVVDNRAVVGVIYDPMLDEMFTCHLGGGATLNDRPMRVSDTTSPQSALLGISFNFQNSKDSVSRVVGDLIANGTSFRMLGAGALSLAHCAAGRTDGFWEAFMKPWDAAAGLALVAEAGGATCDYSASDGFAHGNAVLVSNGSLSAYFSGITHVAMRNSTGSKT